MPADFWHNPFVYRGRHIHYERYEIGRRLVAV